MKELDDLKVLYESTAKRELVVRGKDQIVGTIYNSTAANERGTIQHVPLTYQDKEFLVALYNAYPKIRQFIEELESGVRIKGIDGISFKTLAAAKKYTGLINLVKVMYHQDRFKFTADEYELLMEVVEPKSSEESNEKRD